MSQLTFRFPFVATAGQTEFDIPTGAVSTSVTVNGSSVTPTGSRAGFVSISPRNAGDNVVVDVTIDLTAPRPQWVLDYLGLTPPPPDPIPFTPVTDPSGLLISWIDISDAASVTDVGSGVISAILDKKAGSSWTQATSGKRGTRATGAFSLPTISVPTGGGYVNSSLTLPQNMRMETATDGGNGFQIAMDGTDGGPCGNYGSPPKKGIFTCRWAQGQQIGPGGSNGGIYYLTGSPVSLNYAGDSLITASKGGCVLAVTNVKGNGQIGYGRWLDTVGGAGLLNRASDWGRTADMDLGELIFLSGAVDTALRQKYEGYLAEKWGLRADLPSDHPYKSTSPTV